MFGRLIANWVYGGFLAGLLLLLLAPVLVDSGSAPLVATFLCLPVYMVHQYEEHDNDRFRQFVNQRIGKGEVLSPLAVFIINVPGVWGIVGISLALAATVGVGFDLITVYLIVVNGVVHVIYAVIKRSYNPGLGTAIALFLPVGGYGIAAIQHSAGWWRECLDACGRCGHHCHSMSQSSSTYSGNDPTSIRRLIRARRNRLQLCHPEVHVFCGPSLRSA